MVMSRRWAVFGLVLLLSSVGTHAVADSVRVPDPRDPVGAHDIRQLVVDNTGDRVGATVVHRGSRWQGRLRLTFDVSGTRAPEYVAVIKHARPLDAVFRRADGRPWRCASRTAASRPAGNRTLLRAHRKCFQGAERLRVRATVFSPGRPKDTAVSGPVLQQSRPNVLSIMVDDMRADELRYMPWTRRLIANQGVNFRNSFAPFPLCCPARASALTGRYAHNHQVYGVFEPYGFPSFDDRSTLATWLRKDGYATVYLGKYLNGYGWMPEPGKSSGLSSQYVPPGWAEWRASVDGGDFLPRDHPLWGSTYHFFNTTLNANGDGYENYRGKYQSRVYGRLSAEIIRRRAASNRPFFLSVSYTAPHNGGPEEPDDPGTVLRDDGVGVRYGTPARPADVRGMFDDVITVPPGATWADSPHITDKPAYLADQVPINAAEWDAILELTRQRAESLYVVDQAIKRTIDALAATGELEETLITFTSDNGYFLGEQMKRQGKILPHDPSLRVPFLMRGPGIPAGEDRFDPFTSIDYAPTVLGLTGATARGPMDGKSLLPIARRGDRGWTRAVLTETGPQSRYTRLTDESGAPVPDGHPDQDRRWAIGIRTDRYLYVDIAPRTGEEHGEEELYDLAADPHQFNNLAYRTGENGYGDVLDLLRGELQRMRACDGKECSAPMAPELWAAPGESVLNRRP
jgi:N-acetylglucosamine-6-sulfatase